MRRKIINGLLILIPPFFRLLDIHTPKDNKMLFIGSGDGKYRSGSSNALNDYIKRNGIDLKTYYYLPNESAEPLKLREYLKAGRMFLRARYLVTTNPPGDFFPFTDWSSRKVLINFGHGTPVKNVGFADPNCSKYLLRSFKRIGRGRSIYPVSSGLEEAWLTKCFQFDPSVYRRYGQPRCDRSNAASGQIEGLSMFYTAPPIDRNYRRGSSRS